MRTTVTLDDELLASVEELSGIRDRSQLLREALLALRHRIASERLSLLGGSEPALTAAPRRRVTLVAEPDAAPYDAVSAGQAKKV
jgi:hypothetical protein